MSINNLDFNRAHQIGDKIYFESLGFNHIQECFSRKSDFKPGFLDLAPAHSNIVHFCATCGGIYYSFSDFYSTILNFDRQLNGNTTDATFSGTLTKHINKLNRLNVYHGNLSLDVILLWDIFNYLKRDNIIKLIALLSPMCKKGSLLYALFWLTDQMPGLPGSFTLTTPRSVVYEFQEVDMIPTPGFTAQSIMSMMPSFKPNRMSASESGILETILEFDELADPPDPNLRPSNLLLRTPVRSIR